MNKVFKQMLLAIICFISICASAQTLISPITINLPANPPANTAEWATALPPAMILAQTKLVNGQVNGMVQESKILVTIKSGGSKICGSYTPQTAPISGFNAATKSWTGTNVLSLLGQECTLKPGSYELCVQFYSFDLRLIGESCKPFTIADKKQDAESYSPPQNIFPNNEKSFKAMEMKAPLTFRWTPVIPKPKVAVTYRLKVWQLMQGQNGAQAMKNNTPIVEKEVSNLTQAVVANLYTGPCKSPYLCNYVWNVEASKKTQMGELEMLGTSEPTSFKIATNNVDIQIDSLKFGCCENGKQSIYIKVKNNLATAADIIAIKYKVNGVGAALALTPVSPTLPKNIVGNATQVFTASVDCINNANFIKILVDAEATLDPDNTETEVASDTLKCACNLCDSNVVKWALPTQINYSYSLTNNTATLNGPISFGPYPIVKLSTEIVDFYWYTEGDCKKCNNNDYYFGNLIGGNLTSMLGGTSVAGPGGTPIPSSHQLDFISPTLSGVTLSKNINLNISLPPQTQLSCCTDCFRFCIRYTATFMQNGVCKTCSIVKCYETKRVHKKVGLQMFPPLNDCGETGVIIVKDKTDIKGN
jgi:hypothetical protein